MTEVPGGLPGQQLAARPLHFIWILDISGSMHGDKIQTLNFAIRESIPAMQQSAGDNPNAQVLIRAVTFSDGARWHIADAQRVDEFRWTDVNALGVTDMGAALDLVAQQLKMPPMDTRALPPVLVLVSDGQPTDDFDGGLARLMAEPWAQKSVRIAIAVGADADETVLQQFIGHDHIKPLQATNAASLVEYIKWASTAVVKAASTPPSMASDPLDRTGDLPPVPNVPIPAPPVVADTGGADSVVW